ncbi:MAG TPA: hypothetical protein DHU96_17545 [Actinobacteria bacterium]|nr:hypothetical protein [Actinomycetota bacterium]
MYKTELIKPRAPWRSLAAVELAIAEYVDWFSTRRLHTAIGGVHPPSTRPPTLLKPSPPRGWIQQLRRPQNPGRFTRRSGRGAGGHTGGPALEGSR